MGVSILGEWLIDACFSLLVAAVILLHVLQNALIVAIGDAVLMYFHDRRWIIINYRLGLNNSLFIWGQNWGIFTLFLRVILKTKTQKVIIIFAWNQVTKLKMSKESCCRLRTLCGLRILDWGRSIWSLIWLALENTRRYIMVLMSNQRKRGLSNFII